MRDRRVSLLSHGLLISLLPIALARGATPINITSGPGYSVWSVGDVQAPLVATGRIPPYTWSISAQPSQLLPRLLRAASSSPARLASTSLRRPRQISKSTTPLHCPTCSSTRSPSIGAGMAMKNEYLSPRRCFLRSSSQDSSDNQSWRLNPELAS